MRPVLLPFTLAVALLTVPALANAHDDHDHDHSHDHSHDHDSLGAHVHGEAHLEAAFSGQEIELLLSTPAVNIVGFEHAPRDEDQRERLEKAIESLSQEPILEMANLDCTLESSDVSTPMTDDSFEGSHANINVEQHLQCDQPVAGGRVNAGFMAAFSGIEALRVTWISDQSQGSEDLTQEATSFSLR